MDYPTKSTARESIREARRALRDLEAALLSPGPVRDYVMDDDESVARLIGALYDTRDAISHQEESN